MDWLSLTCRGWTGPHDLWEQRKFTVWDDICDKRLCRHTVWMREWEWLIKAAKQGVYTKAKHVILIIGDKHSGLICPLTFGLRISRLMPIAQSTSALTTSETTSLSPGIKISPVQEFRHQLGLSSKLREVCVICEGSPAPEETSNSHRYSQCAEQWLIIVS